jgi:hypothetical protein
MESRLQPGSEAAREPQVLIEMARLDKQIESAGASLEHLEQRLSSVLRPTGPSAALDPRKEAPERPLVEVAERIRLFARRVETLEAVANDIRNRLEI